MTLVGRDQQEFLKRREATREAASKNPRGPATVAMALMRNLAGATTPGYFTEGAMLKAQCKRLANRCHVIDNVVFNFDKNGICRIVNQANVIYAFKHLLKMHGVVELDTTTELPLNAAPAQPSAPAVPPPAPDAPEPVVEEELETSPPDLVVGAVDEDEAPAEESKPVDKDNRRKPAKK